MRLLLTLLFITSLQAASPELESYFDYLRQNPEVMEEHLPGVKENPELLEKYFDYIRANPWLLNEAKLKEDQDPTKMNLEPLYEIGAGVFHAQFPHYPGSKEKRAVTLPFPTFVYRGRYIRAKRDEGLRGKFLDTKRLEIDISMDGTLPSENKDTPIREGMPELDTLIEVGPALIYHINLPKSSNDWKFDFHLALRGAFSTDLKRFDTQGLQLNPFLSISKTGFFGKKKGLFFASAGLKLASLKWQKFYYEVAPEFATTQRHAYHSQSGFAEASAAVFGFYPVTNDWWIFSGVINSFYKNAANRSSPLLEKDDTLSYSIGFYYNFYKSAIKVFD